MQGRETEAGAKERKCIQSGRAGKAGRVGKGAGVVKGGAQWRGGGLGFSRANHTPKTVDRRGSVVHGDRKAGTTEGGEKGSSVCKCPVIDRQTQAYQLPPLLGLDNSILGEKRGLIALTKLHV